MRPYAAAQLIGKVKNATPGMVIATMAHGIEAAIRPLSAGADAADIMGEPANVRTSARRQLLSAGASLCVERYSSRNWAAIWMDSTLASALLRVSCHSVAGTESSTMPAPACTLASWSRRNAVRMAMAMSMLPEKSK